MPNVNPDELLIRIDENVTHLKEEIIGSADRKGRLPAAEETLDAHEKQLNFWRGAIAIMAFLLVIGGAVGAWHIWEGDKPAATPSHAQR